VWNPLASHECLALRDVRVSVRVGVHAWEHERPQLLSVDVELYRRRERFVGGTLADCLDYDRIHDHLTEIWPARAHVELLERLADDLIDLCLEDGRVEACRVIIRKPEVYPGTAVPEISVYRLRPGRSAGDAA
jgi:dihydroneopterin aldolase